MGDRMEAHQVRLALTPAEKSKRRQIVEDIRRAHGVLSNEALREIGDALRERAQGRKGKDAR